MRGLRPWKHRMRIINKRLEGVSGEFVPKDEIEGFRAKIDKLTTDNESYRKINEGQAMKYLKEKARHLKETTKLKYYYTSYSLATIFQIRIGKLDF